jgi:glycosyltransferase involved in cell wall biosynthesis
VDEQGLAAKPVNMDVDRQRLAPRRFAVMLPGIFSSRTSSGISVLKAGGDIRTAKILSRRPPGAPIPVLLTSKAAIEAFEAEQPVPLGSVSIDGVFDAASASLPLLIFFLGLRALLATLYLTATKSGRSIELVYSPSNALPDSIVGFLAKRLRRKRAWVALVHHIPERSRLEYGSEFEARISQLALEAGLSLIRHGADQIIAYHTPTIKRIVSTGFKASRLERNANGVDLAEFGPDPLPPGDRLPASVICVGRLSRQKGIPALLRIWSTVVHSRPGAILTLVGAEDTLTYADVATMAKSLGISESVKVKGSLSRPELVAELRMAKLFAAPSFVEGWGLAVLEAMACGTPVVAWDLEAYSPFHPAITTVPLSDEASFGNKVSSLLAEDEEWSRRSAAGIQLAKLYSWDKVAAKEWEIIQSAIPGNDR